MDSPSTPDRASMSLVDRVIWFCLTNRLLVVLAIVLTIVWGLMVAPFDWELNLPRDPVPVDAIPDIGENQQVVFTDWPGRSPQDIEDQITYPLTVALMGIPGIKTVRSQSMFGFSSIYVIFDETVEFYWSRSRIIEKLNSLPPDTLPEGVMPALGPDATALGQVFWYTLEGRDPDGNPAGGWDPDELRSAQDWYVRFGLLAAEGISEVASIGGFVREYQIDVDPDAMRAHDVRLTDVFTAVRDSNIDVGARTIDVNNVEYVVRGLGFIETLEDLDQVVVKMTDHVPIYLKDIAHVTMGPALRRGALDKEGAEAVGGVVVVRHGANPLEAIHNVKERIADIAPGMPAKAFADQDRISRTELEAFADQHGFRAYDGHELNHDSWLRWLRNNPRENWPDGITISEVTVIPFYDRTGLIYETLGTLREAITLQILITIIVVIVMVMHLRISMLISGVLPMAVLMCFIGMKYAGVDANIVALSGIAISIGTVVDMGVILCENTLKRLGEADPDDDPLLVTYRAASEVGGAVLTAILTTVVSFLPVFTMTGPEGKLFRPLAFTKTFALIASVLLALLVLPTLAHMLLGTRVRLKPIRIIVFVATAIIGLAILVMTQWWWAGLIVLAIAGYHTVMEVLPQRGETAAAVANLIRRPSLWIANGIAVLVVGIVLTSNWLPLGATRSFAINFTFVAVMVGGVLGIFSVFLLLYPRLLGWFLDHKMTYLSVPAVILIVGLSAWLGVGRVFWFAPQFVRETELWTKAYHAFPGLGREFMPPLDEGSYLFMPTVMPHASIGEALDVLQFQDQAFAAIPEVESVVGKIGRAESPLDPAPLSMIETVINYYPEYIVDEDGYRKRFRFNTRESEYVRDEHGDLIPDPQGRPYRQWRDHIQRPDDIWDEIVKAGELPGVTSAPRLQPIATRLVMLQTGMRAPMGVKVQGPDLDTIESVGVEIEQFLQEVPGVEPATVFAERIVGKPYLEIHIDRDAIARYGLSIREVQDVIEVGIGGRPLTMTVEGRERYPVRVRYKRELRDSIEALERILVPTQGGAQIPLIQLADIEYSRGPQMIKSEDTFLVGYVTFDKQDGYSEVDVVEDAQAILQSKLESGEWSLPSGVSYTFAGDYEQQVRAQETLSIVLPLALFVIFIVLYLHFRSVVTALLIFVGITVAWGGGFILLWLYGQPWFLDFSFAGTNMRDLFQIQPVMLSVAIWVGFLALFGIATDDGVVIASFLDQSFRKRQPETISEIRKAVLEGGKRRIRPCLMTTATTILALLPVLTSTGRGSDVMVPMAIPSFGGMLFALVTLFLVPVLYCAVQEIRFRAGGAKAIQSSSLTDETGEKE